MDQVERESKRDERSCLEGKKRAERSGHTWDDGCAVRSRYTKIREKDSITAFLVKGKSLLPEDVPKEDALRAISREISQKAARRMPSYGELIRIELQYIPSFFWIIQGIFVVAIILLLKYTSMHGGALPDYLWWASAAAAWMGALGCGSFSRHFSGGMAELEQSCYFNLVQVWTIRMCLSGVADILLLLFCIGMIAGNTNSPFLQVGIYLLVPFVLANACCLLFFMALRGGRNRYVQFVTALLMGAAALVPAKVPGIYGAEYVWFWLLALFGGLVLFGWQLRLLYGKVKGGEVLCWN